MKAEKLNGSDTQSTTAINDYDATAYFTEGKPICGSDHHVAVFDGVTYLFASEDNKRKFEASSEKHTADYEGGLQ